MSEQKLTAELRTEFGKGFCPPCTHSRPDPGCHLQPRRRPIHQPARPRLRWLSAFPTPLLAIDVDGERHLTLVKDIQRDPVKRIIEHVDLQTVGPAKVTIDAIHVSGEVAPGAVASLKPPRFPLRPRQPTYLPSRVDIRRPQGRREHPRIGPRPAEGFHPAHRRRHRSGPYLRDRF